MYRQLRGLRGAIFSNNTESDISSDVIKLYDSIIEANRLKETDIVSIFFSVTNDITVLNPATALRKSGRALELALFCLAEAPINNPYNHVIRILIHGYTTVKPVPIYLNGAEALRRLSGDKPSHSNDSLELNI